MKRELMCSVMSLAVLACDRLQSLSGLSSGFILCAHEGNAVDSV